MQRIPSEDETTPRLAGMSREASTGPGSSGRREEKLRARAAAFDPGLLGESLDEAEYLWARWNQAFERPEYDLPGLVRWVEERLFGSFEGVLAAGEAASAHLLDEALESGGTWRLGVATHLLASLGTDNALERVARRWAVATEAELSAMRRGVEVLSSERFLRRLCEKVRRRPCPQSRALMEALAFRRIDPGKIVLDYVSSDVPGIPGAAARAAMLGSLDFADQCIDSVMKCAPFAECRAEAVIAGLQIGMQTAWRRCRRWVLDKEPDSHLLFLAMALLGGDREHSALYDALESNERRREAIWALGFAGTRAAGDALADCIARGIEPALSAEALCSLSGIEPARDGSGLDRLEEAGDDEELAPNPDEYLPIFDGDDVARKWNEARSRLAPGARHLRGKPIDSSVLIDAVAREPLRRRHSWALELTSRTRGKIMINTRAFVAEQRAQLGRIGR